MVKTSAVLQLFDCPENFIHKVQGCTTFWAQRKKSTFSRDLRSPALCSCCLFI